MDALPSLFITHGSPGLGLDDCPARDFIAGLNGLLPRPRAVLCVSAHWERPRPAVSGAEAPETIHDFFGFPEALYQMRYPAPGAPELAARVKGLLDDAGIGCEVHPRRGLDHGAWVPLKLAWPEADIPVTQLSVQTALGPEHHLALGRALAPLRREGVLVLASGSATHNLRDFHKYALDAAPADYAVAFAAWLDDVVTRGDVATLADWQRRAPEAAHNHPTPEHFLPIFAALGAGADNGHGPGRRLHASYTYGVFYMGAYAFG